MVTLTRDNSAQTGGVTSLIGPDGTAFLGDLYNQDGSALSFEDVNILNYYMGSGNDTLYLEATPLNESGNQLNLDGGGGVDYLSGDFSNLIAAIVVGNGSITSTGLSALNFERYSLTLGLGNDSVTLSHRQYDETLSGGAGNDTLSLDNSAQSAGASSSITFGVANAFSGTLANANGPGLTYSQFESLTYKMGSGADTLTVTAGVTGMTGLSADGGGGIDALTADLSALTTNLTLGNATLFGGGISLAKFETYNITFGSGNDSVNLVNRTASEGLIMGAGTDSVTINNSAQTLGVASFLSSDGGTFTGSLMNRTGAATQVTGVENLTYLMSKGNDFLYVTATALATAGNHLTLDGGLGADVLQGDFSAVNANMTVNGAGVTGGGLAVSGFESMALILGSGNDSVTFGVRNGNDQFDAGSGDDSLSIDISAVTAAVNGSIVSLGGTTFSGNLPNGAANSTHFGNVEHVVYKAGSGNDLLNIAGAALGVAGNTLSADGGGGVDTVYLNLATVAIGLTVTNTSVTGTGLTLSNFDNLNLTLGAAANSVTLTNRTGQESLGGNTGLDTLSLDNSAQTVGVANSSLAGTAGAGFSGSLFNLNGLSMSIEGFEVVTYAMGSGNDKLQFDGAALADADNNLTVAAGGGSDTLNADLSASRGALTVTNSTISGDGLSLTGFETYEILKLGAFNDTITLTDRSAVEGLWGGDGADSLSVDNSVQTADVSSGIYGTSTSFGGYFIGSTGFTGPYFEEFEHVDYTMGSGGDYLSVYGDALATAGNSLSVAAGAGDDILWAILSAARGGLTLSDGNLTGTGVSFSQFEIFASLTLSNFADTVSLSDRHAEEVLNGGAGVDSLSIDNSAATAGVASSLNNANSAFSGHLLNGVSQTIISRFEVVTYKMGSGNDTLTVDGNSLAISGNRLNLDGGGGSDSLFLDIRGLGFTTVSAVDTVLTIGDSTFGHFETVELLLSHAGSNVTVGSESDSVVGGDGGDWIDGGLGDDTLDGGDGVNTVAYLSALSGVAVSLALQGGGQLTGAGLDTLSGFQNLTGSFFADSLTGDGNNNVLNGSAGADTLYGGLGDDLYIVENTGDAVIEATGAGTDTIASTVTYSLAGKQVENLTLFGPDAVNATGNGLANGLNGNDSHNRLDGGAGNDTMAGGLGNDTYVVNTAGDVVTEAAAAGTDLVESGVTWALGVNSENLTLTGTGNINGTGHGAANVLTGNSGINVLTGGAGNDTYYIQNTGDNVVEAAGEGADLIVSAVTYSLVGRQVEQLTLTGTADLNVTGNSGNNILTGNAGNNLLDGGVGNDTLIGGLGNDTFVVGAAGDVVTENPGEGSDTVQSSVTFGLADNLENLILGGAAAINGYGNGLNNAITGNAAHNLLDGLGGNDSLAGGLGNDTYLVDAVGDAVTEAYDEGTDTVYSTIAYVLGDNFEHLGLIGSDNINATGNALGNNLIGNAGNNRLDGAAGVNSLTGGAGDDTYVVATVNDSVTESASEGTDMVESAITYALGAYVENLILTGSAANGTGNGLNNVLTGNSAVNILTGGAGNDTYYIQTNGDNVVETSTGGTDTVWSSITYSLASRYVEFLYLTGAANLNATGNSFANTLGGNDGANSLNGQGGDDDLNGGLGSDTMIGGAGDDTFGVDNTGDVVTELSGEGTDTVRSSVAYVLGTTLENLVLLGAGNINGTGNEMNNVLSGNDGVNALSGGLGDDTYAIQNSGDSITEASNAGNDTVLSSVTWSLSGKQIENLTLTGTAAIDATGNGLANLLTGNGGINILDGAGGHDRLDGGLAADVMIGGTGNDTYVVDNAGDLTTEAASSGTDTVEASLSWALAANVENLTLTGTAAINATGTSVGNILIGNSGANTLNGKGGADILTGGLGGDIFLFEAGSGGDTVTDFSAAQSDSFNVNAYTHGVTNAALVTQNGVDVLISLGGSNVVTVSNASQADVLAHMIW